VTRKLLKGQGLRKDMKYLFLFFLGIIIISFIAAFIAVTIVNMNKKDSYIEKHKSQISNDFKPSN